MTYWEWIQRQEKIFRNRDLFVCGGAGFSFFIRKFLFWQWEKEKMYKRMGKHFVALKCIWRLTKTRFINRRIIASLSLNLSRYLIIKTIHTFTFRNIRLAFDSYAFHWIFLFFLSSADFNQDKKVNALKSMTFSVFSFYFISKWKFITKLNFFPNSNKLSPVWTECHQQLNTFYCFSWRFFFGNWIRTLNTQIQNVNNGNWMWNSWYLNKFKAKKQKN